MRELLCMSAVAFSMVSGCRSGASSGRMDIVDDPAEMKAEILRWIPVGTPEAEAIAVMEENGFRCSQLKDDEGRYVYCDFHKRKGVTISCRVQSKIRIDAGSVRDVQVFAGYIAP